MGAEPGEEGAAERVAGEQPVQIAAGDPAVRADRAVAAAAEIQHRARDARAGGDAEMHLVAAHRRGAGDIDAGGLDQPLVAAQRRLDVEETQPLGLAGRALMPVWIGDTAAEHLVAAAQAEDMPALPGMR